MKNWKTNKIKYIFVWVFALFCSDTYCDESQRKRDSWKLKGGDNECYFSFKDEGSVLRAET